jgi:hypothetical protein
MQLNLQLNLPPRLLRISVGCAGLLLLLIATLALIPPSNGPLQPSLDSITAQNLSLIPVSPPQVPWWTTEQLEPKFAYAQYATNLDYLCNAVSKQALVVLILQVSN